MTLSPSNAGLFRSSETPEAAARLASMSKLDRASLLGAGLAAVDETCPGEDCEFRFAVFDLTTARARRSWSRSFLRALDELREIANFSISQVPTRSVKVHLTASGRS